MTSIRRSRPRSLVLLGLLTAAAAVGAGCSTTQDAAGRADGADPEIEIVAFSDVDWEALNPARGDASPRAADLWGDRSGPKATGFLVRFADGFSSPPHIHNTTYRGVVIGGLVHNDDPGAAASWMPPGSYWTQPAGESHITAAQGSACLAYIEIQHGPYLVMPSAEAFDTGERPVNLHASSLVWLDASTAGSIVGDWPASEGPRISYLWGEPQDESASGALVRLPEGFAGSLLARGPSLRIVVVEGLPRLHRSAGVGAVVLEPGSYAGVDGGGSARLTLTSEEASLLYVRSEGPFDIIAAPTR